MKQLTSLRVRTCSLCILLITFVCFDSIIETSAVASEPGTSVSTEETPAVTRGQTDGPRVVNIGQLQSAQAGSHPNIPTQFRPRYTGQHLQAKQQSEAGVVPDRPSLHITTVEQSPTLPLF